MKLKTQIISVFVIAFFSCQHQNKNKAEANVEEELNNLESIFTNITHDSDLKSIHIIVALCDNKYQGIVP